MNLKPQQQNKSTQPQWAKQANGEAKYPSDTRFLSGLLPEVQPTIEVALQKPIKAIRILFQVRLPTHVILICSKLTLKL